MSSSDGAKAVAALRGESLRQLMTTALQRELDVGRPAEAVPPTGAADDLLRNSTTWLRK